MNDDNFELEELIVPEEKKDKYEREIRLDKQNIDNGPDDIEYLDIDDEVLRKVGLTVEEVQEIAKNHGKEAALKFIKTLKDNHDVREDTNEETLDSSNNDKANDDINLLTPTFISPLTNETIKLDAMNVYDRIGEIYYHTGISINLNDPILKKGYVQCMNSFDSFLKNLSSNDTKDFKKKLGKNWKEQLLQQCGESWNKVITKEISKEKDKASDRLREDLKAEKIKSEQLGERVNELEISLSNEKRKSSLLTTKVDMLENANIDLSLEQLRTAKEDLKREKEQLFRPDFVTDRDINVYNYVVSKADSSPKARK